MSDLQLSSQGRRRREQILLLAKAESRRRRRPRRVMMSLCAIVIAMGSALFVARRAEPGRAGPVRGETPRLLAGSSPSPAIQIIQTDPTITDRLTIHPAPARWTRINNAELIRDLADSGRPGGIVAMNGRTILLMREPILP